MKNAQTAQMTPTKAARWSSAATAVLAGCAAAQQAVADHREAGSENQPRRQHQQIGCGQRRLLRLCPVGPSKDSAAERTQREAAVMIV
jgi:hypothetical protein